MLKYVVFLVLCLIVSIVYTTTRRSSFRGIARDAAIMMGYICGGMAVIGLVVFLLCQLK